MGEVRIGTSGWSYPGGPGTWKGIFYPPKQRGRAFDELSYYAQHFNTVEVNSSFYRPPEPSTVAAWAARTPADFDFSLKLYQKFTHLAMHQKATSLDLPGDAANAAIPMATRADVDGFRRVLDPLANAGKLGAVLAQFPPSFRDTDDAREYMVWLLQAFREYPLAVELRHRTWSDHESQIVTLLNEFGASWVQIDEPKFRFSIQQSHLPNLRRLYYMRLHGRNAEKWWTHDHPDERYNYLYTPGELEGFVDTVSTVRRLVQKIYVYMNNHFAGKAVANAAMLRERLGQDVPGPYEHGMVERYPELARIIPRASAMAAASGAASETASETANLFDEIDAAEGEPAEAPEQEGVAEDAESREG